MQQNIFVHFLNLKKNDFGNTITINCTPTFYNMNLQRNLKCKFYEINSLQRILSSIGEKQFAGFLSLDLDLDPETQGTWYNRFVLYNS